MDTVAIIFILSFIIIIVAFSFLFFPPVRTIGITTLSIYAIMAISFISYLASKQFGPVIPSAILILFLSIIIVLVLNINTYRCQTDSTGKNGPASSCFEQFGTPSGISTNDKGEWCYRTGNYCVASDGTTVNLASQQAKDLTAKLETTKEQCQERIQNLSQSVNEKEKQTSVSTGPCITSDGKWGVILPQYGRKCVPTSEIGGKDKKKTDGKKMDGKKMDGKKAPENKIDTSKLSKEEINNRYNALKKKQESDKADKKPHWRNGKFYDGETGCLPVGTNFDKICKSNYGKFYKADLPTICACPFTSTEDCQKHQRETADCYCDLPNDKSYTDCKPINSDFDYECQIKYGSNFGYKNILNGRDGCCPKGYARAECSSSSYSGIEFIENPIKCIVGNNYYEHLEECQNTYPDKKVVSVKDIEGYNCNAGYYKSTCIFS